MGIGGLVTDTWVVSEGGCASAASGDLRSGAPHTILSYICIGGDLVGNKRRNWYQQEREQRDYG